MTREEKHQIVQELSEKFAENSFFYITDAGGMTVAGINRFRRLASTKEWILKFTKTPLSAKH
jgi:large subunit ribosomal protein L10